MDPAAMTALSGRAAHDMQTEYVRISERAQGLPWHCTPRRLPNLGLRWRQTKENTAIYVLYRVHTRYA